MEKLQVKYIAINDLIPYVNNSRTHTENQINQIVASIKEFGFTNPILIDGENGIIAGHGRVLAAQKLDINQIPCIELSHLTEHQKKAYVIADNKLALNAGWDEELLKIELESLNELEFDVNLLGFDDLELETILETEPEEPQEDSQNKELGFIIQYNIVFDTEDQQQVWYDFIRFLKQEYQESETIGERLSHFIRENNYVSD